MPRPAFSPGPVPGLVLARLRGRASAAALTAAAVGAAVAMIVVVTLIGAVATDRSLTRTLSTTGADRPVVRVSHFTESSRDREELADRAASVLPDLEAWTGPAVRGVIIRELTDLGAPVFVLLVGMDDPGAWTTLLDGRLPEPCTASRCEALLASEVEAPAGYDVGRPTAGFELPIVGRGLIDPSVPFGALDQAGPAGERPAFDYQTERRSPAVLLVNGVDALAAHPTLERTNRTYVWTAPVRPDRIHRWTAGAFESSVASVARRLSDDDAAFTSTGPTGLIADELARAGAAGGRLLAIGSFAVAILLAFTVFAALLGRGDLGAELDRLRALGARRRDAATLVVLEAAIPVVIGGALGWLAGLAAGAALAAAGGVPVLPVLADAVLTPVPLAATVAILALAIVSIVAVNAPASTRPGLVRMGGAAALTAVALIGWQLATSGGLDPSALAASLASPAVVLLAPALAFVVALGFLLVVPRLLRAAAARLRGAALPVRLSVLSLARDPVRPAATITLLAFSIGSIVFAAGWSASLRQGIEDQAAYRAGLDLRVVELGTGLSVSQSVVPVARYEALGEGVRAVPVFRGPADLEATGRIDVVALPPAAIATLPGWRGDFADRPPDELATALTVPEPAGGWRQAGHALDPRSQGLRLAFRWDGDALKLGAVVETPDGDHVRLPMGTITARMTEASARLPASARGGTLIALEFTHPRLIYGEHQHPLRRATVTFEGLEGLVGPEPVDVEVFTVESVVVRATQATDDLALPAVVSPAVAAAVDPDGILRLGVGGGATIELRVVATARAFPTVVAPDPRFVVVALEPWLMALNAEAPAAGRPTEMWLAADDEASLAAARAKLAADPFRFPVVTSRTALVEQQGGDPLSQSIAVALLVAGFAGLALSIGGVALGAAADLRDERGELADLEAQGVPPSGIRRHVLARSGWLVGLGGAAGLVVGVALTFVVTSALALSAAGTLPIPPLRVVVPLLPVIGLVGGVAIVVLVLVVALARLAHRAPSASGGGRPGRRGARLPVLPPPVSHPGGGGDG